MRVLSLDSLDALLQLLGKQVTGSPAVAAAGAPQRCLQRLQQRRLHVLQELELERNRQSEDNSSAGLFIPRENWGGGTHTQKHVNHSLKVQNNPHRCEQAWSCSLSVWKYILLQL